MNDLHTQNRHDVIANNGEDRPAVNREVERASTHRPHLRPRHNRPRRIGHRPIDGATKRLRVYP